MLPYVPSPAEDADLELDDEDDADAIPKCVVVDNSFDWEDDRLPETAWNDTVIYETHVKGFTQRHPEMRDDLRGTYAGLASAPALAYFRDLGVTAVELLPIHHIADEGFLARPRRYQLLGLLLHRLPRAARALCGHRHGAASRCPSSRGW